MSEIIGRHYIDLDIHQNVYISFTCKQYNTAEYMYVTVYDNSQPYTNLATSIASIDVKINTPDNRQLYMSTLDTTDSWRKCASTDPGAILVTAANWSEVSSHIENIQIGDYYRIYKATSSCITITSDDIIKVYLPPAVFLEAGRADGELILYGSNGKETTMSFQMRIIESVYSSQSVIDDVFNTDEVTTLKDFINARVESAQIYETKAEEASTLSESWAVGGTNSRTGEDTNNSKYWSEQSAASATSASQSKSSASTSESNAASSAVLSESWAVGSTNSRTGENTNNSKYYSEQASSSETNAAKSATTATSKATEANNSATAAASSETNAEIYAKSSESWTVGGTGSRSDEDTNNAKYWAGQARIAAAAATSGGLIPMGTITFEQLPTIYTESGKQHPYQLGWLYNISNKFTTTDDFEEGAGIKYNEGSNVYCTDNSKWDVLASASTAGGGIIVSTTEPEDQSAGSSWLKPKN